MSYITEELNKIYAIDIEGDLIPSTVVYCVCTKNAGTGEETRLRTYEDIRAWFSDRVAEGSRFIAHNGIEYDFPTLNRIVGTRIPITAVIDSMLMSMLYSPSIAGGHSLAAWGERLRHPKTGHDDFSKYTPEMEEYCMNDTQLCLLVYLALRKRMLSLGFTNTGIEIEHRSWELIRQQRKNGFAFNVKEAHILYAKLKSIVNELTEKVNEYWPPKLECTAEFAKAYKKDGNPTSGYERHLEQYVKLQVCKDTGRYRAYEYVYFNVGSPPQRVEKLLALGWKPWDDEWNIAKTGPNKGKRTSPKVTIKGKLVPSLIQFIEDEGKEEVKLLAKWIEINARATMVNTWIEAYNETSGCIHGRLWLANTLRYRHSEPNSANIPAVRIKEIKDDSGQVIKSYPLLGQDGAFTYEARDLWTRRSSDRLLVGVDAKGIQLRVLAHYLNNKDFTDAVLGGDPHSYNQEVGGFRTRAIAKTFIYAFLLGCGDAKAGQIIGGSPRDGREIKSRFIGNFPGLRQLLDELAGQVERTGRIVLCDGTPIIVSKPHTRLGYLLQGDESRIMKKAAILTAASVRKRKLDVLKVGDIHDEWQNDVLKGHVDEFKNDICERAFQSSGEFFNYRIPIACDSKVGMTWAQTH